MSDGNARRTGSPSAMLPARATTLHTARYMLRMARWCTEPLPAAASGAVRCGAAPSDRLTERRRIPAQG